MREFSGVDVRIWLLCVLGTALAPALSSGQVACELGNLPPGVTVSFQGSSDSTSVSCSLTNNTNEPVTVNIRAGRDIVTNPGGYQDLMIGASRLITVPPNGLASTRLPGLCLNSGIPSPPAGLGGLRVASTVRSIPAEHQKLAGDFIEGVCALEAKLAARLSDDLKQMIVNRILLGPNLRGALAATFPHLTSEQISVLQDDLLACAQGTDSSIWDKAGRRTWRDRLLAFERESKRIANKHLGSQSDREALYRTWSAKYGGLLADIAVQDPATGGGGGLAPYVDFIRQTLGELEKLETGQSVPTVDGESLPLDAATWDRLRLKAPNVDRYVANLRQTLAEPSLRITEVDGDVAQVDVWVSQTDLSGAGAGEGGEATIVASFSDAVPTIERLAALAHWLEGGGRDAVGGGGGPPPPDDGAVAAGGGGRRPPGGDVYDDYDDDDEGEEDDDDEEADETENGDDDGAAGSVADRSVRPPGSSRPPPSSRPVQTRHTFYRHIQNAQGLRFYCVEVVNGQITRAYSTDQALLREGLAVAAAAGYAVVEEAQLGPRDTGQPWIAEVFRDLQRSHNYLKEHHAWYARASEWASEHKVFQRGLGMLAVVGGIEECVLGVGMGVVPSGVTQVAGGALLFHGLDTIVAGLCQAWTGEFTPTLTEHAFGWQADMAIGILGPGLAKAATNTAKRSMRLFGEGGEGVARRMAKSAADESAANALRRVGYVELPASLPGSRGFVKVGAGGAIDDIMIIESKYAAKKAAQLATGSAGKQAGRGWIDDMVQQMLKSGDEPLAHTGEFLNNNRNLIRRKVRAFHPKGLAGVPSSGKRLTGVTVLEDSPELVELSEVLGARRFRPPPDEIWRGMSPAQQAAARKKFLDRAIRRGDDIVWGNSPTRVTPASQFSDDLVAQAARRPPAGTLGKVIRNSLEQHELEFAQKIVGFRGGELVGASRHRLPGIDATLDGIPISLKTTQGGLGAVLRHASKAESQALKAGYRRVELFIEAPNVRAANLLDFAGKGNLSQIPNQGTISSINILTEDGWVQIIGSGH